MSQLVLFPPPARAVQLELPFTYTESTPPTMNINPLRVAVVSAVGSLLVLPVVAALALHLA